MRFLFVDRIMQSLPAQWIRGIKHITLEDAYLCDDGEGRLCFIPSLVGETIGQLAAWNIMAHTAFTKRPVAGIAANARLYRPAYVGETLHLEAFIERIDESAAQYQGKACIGDEVIFSIDGALGPLLPMTRFIEEVDVRQQYTDIDRPGEWPLKQSVTFPLLTSSASIRCIPPLVFDRVLASKPGVFLRAEKRVTQAAPYFPDHFPKQPVLPMTVLLECKLNLAQVFINEAGFEQAYRVREIQKIKMSEFIYPGDVIVTDVHLKHQEATTMVLRYHSEVDGKRVCVVDVVMQAEGEV